MIDIIEIGSFKTTELDFSKYGLKKQKEFIIDRFFKYNSDNNNQLQNYLSSKKFILSNYRDENQKYIQQILLPPADGTIKFDISRNYVNYIPFHLIPDSIIEFDVSHTFINQTEIDKFPSSCQKIKISETPISIIPEFPPNCKSFIARGCRLTNLHNLPTVIEELSVEGNNLSRLPDNLTECRNIRKLCYEGNRNIQVSQEQLNFIEVIFERIRIQDERIEIQNKVETKEDIEKIVDFIETDGATDNNIIEIGNTKNELYTNRKINQIIGNSQNVHNTMINSNMEIACKKLKEFYENKVEFSEVYIIEKGFLGGKNKKNVTLPEFIKHYCSKKILKALGNFNYSKLKVWLANKELLFVRANMSLGEIFNYVFFRIHFLEEEVQTEIYELLKYDFEEMPIVCLTGKIGRIINLLNGKCDEVQLIGETKNERIQRVHHLCTNQARANYKNLVYKKLNFTERNKKKIDEECFLFRKILYHLFELELKKMDDVDENERNVWLEPLIINEDEVDKIKPIGNKNQDEIEFIRLAEEECAVDEKK